MHVEWTSYSSPIGALTIVECEAGPLVVEYPHRATSVKWAEGSRQRVELANPRFPGVDVIAASTGLPPGADRRLIAEAAGLLWTARRIAGRVVSRLPENPEWDESGLRMELVR